MPSKSTASPGAGNVSIELDGVGSKELVPSLQAASFLSRQGGGLVGLVQRLASMELDAVVMVIAQGLGLSGQGSKDLPEICWRTGVAELSAPCITFVNHLMNGGRPPAESQGGDGSRPQLGIE